MQERHLRIEQNPIDLRVIHVSRGNLNRRQGAATSEGASPDVGNAIRNRDARKVAAVQEGLPSDTGDAIKNRDARQAFACPEGSSSDAGDRITLNGVGND